MIAAKVTRLTCVDMLPENIIHAQENIQPYFKNIRFLCQDFLLNDSKSMEQLALDKQIKNKQFDAIINLDIFEHIPFKKSHEFTTRVTQLLNKNGTYICGIPTLESQTYASEGSKIGHVNCLSKNDFKTHLKKHFANVFIFWNKR